VINGAPEARLSSGNATNRRKKKVRDRLRLLQASSRCEIEPVRTPLATIR